MNASIARPMEPRRPWTRASTLAALHVYLLLPFGQLHRNQPAIVQLAGWLGRSANSVALKLVNLASLDPQVVASGRKGMANASSLDRALWQELDAHWDTIAKQAAAEFERLAASHGMSPYADVADELATIPEGRTRLATVEVRVNQARFRKAVLASYGATCCISGLQNPELLIASHIMPWSEDTKNRLNPQNGLCLSALHDRAYDQGLLTVMPDFRVRLAPVLRQTASAFGMEAFSRFEGQPITLPERFRPSPEFLAIHARRFGFM
jgi:putative restriction endonuclease